MHSAKFNYRFHSSVQLYVNDASLTQIFVYETFWLLFYLPHHVTTSEAADISHMFKNDPAEAPPLRPRPL